MSKPIAFIQWLRPCEYRETREVLTTYASRTDEIALHNTDTKADVITALADHSKDDVCQFLFIGTHGNSTGIGTTTADFMTWAELWNELSRWKAPPVLWLGACKSSHCAGAWTPLPSSKCTVQWIVGFATAIYPKEIKNVLESLVAMTTVSPITYVDEEIPRIRRDVPGTAVEMFYPAYFDKKHGFLNTDDFTKKLSKDFKAFLQNQH